MLGGSDEHEGFRLAHSTVAAVNVRGRLILLLVQEAAG
jgi:hypothetical protein